MLAISSVCSRFWAGGQQIRRSCRRPGHGVRHPVGWSAVARAGLPHPCRPSLAVLVLLYHTEVLTPPGPGSRATNRTTAAAASAASTAAPVHTNQQPAGQPARGRRTRASYGGSYGPGAQGPLPDTARRPRPPGYPQLQPAAGRRVPPGCTTPRTPTWSPLSAVGFAVVRLAAGSGIVVRSDGLDRCYRFDGGRRARRARRVRPDAGPQPLDVDARKPNGRAARP